MGSWKKEHARISPIRDHLESCLSNHGVITVDDLVRRREIARSGKNPEQAEWSAAHAIAGMHLAHHGNMEVPQCKANPCVIREVSLALFELTTYYFESISCTWQIIEDLERLVDSLTHLDPISSRLRENYDKVIASRDLASKTFGHDRVEAPAWEQFIYLQEQHRQIAETAALQIIGLRNRLDSAPLRHRRVIGQGKRPDLILAAVWGYLGEANLSSRDRTRIFGVSGDDETEAMDRLRHRFADLGDWRSFGTLDKAERLKTPKESREDKE